MSWAWRRDERGAVIPLVALCMAVLIIFTSIAVDLGFQRMARRDMQAVADVVALDLARRLDGNTAAALAPAMDLALTQSVARNTTSVGTPPEVTYRLGTTDAAHVFTPVAGNGIPTAVEVTATTDVDYFFRPGTGGAARVAVAGISDNREAWFKVGSSLVSLNPQTNSIVGQVLNSIVPGASVLGYQGLANANIGLDALGLALGIPLVAASPDQLLNTYVGMNELAVAAATVLQNQGNTAAASVLQNFLNLGVPNTQLNVADLIGVASGQGGPGLGSTVNAAQLLMTSAFLADGDHFVTVPAATLGIPGLASVGLHLTGIEAQQRGGPEDGDSATTSQVTLEVVPQFNINTAGLAQQICALPVNQQNILNALLGGVLNLVSCTLYNLGLGPGLSQLLSVQVTGSPTISARVASVTVTQSIDCTNHRLTLSPSPSAVTLQSNLSLNIGATLAGASLGTLVRLDIPAGAVANGSASPQVFTASGPGTPRGFGTEWTTFSPATARVGSNPLGLANLLQVTPGRLTVLNLDLSGLTSVIAAVIQPVLNTILGQLDTLVLQPVAQLLGLNLAGSDLTPESLLCDQSAVELLA